MATAMSPRWTPLAVSRSWPANRRNTSNTAAANSGLAPRHRPTPAGSKAPEPAALAIIDAFYAGSKPMRLSQFHLATVKEVPADAEIASHQLMLRAGMIRKLASGLYTWSPLGLRVLRKVEAVVREEMDRAGAIEILMPTIQP